MCPPLAQASLSCLGMQYTSAVRINKRIGGSTLPYVVAVIGVSYAPMSRNGAPSQLRITQALMFRRNLSSLHVHWRPGLVCSLGGV